MKKGLKIIILSAHYGDGHVQVSKALQQCFLDKGIRQVKILDLYGKAHPLIDAAARLFYLKSCAYLPKLYGWFYYGTQNLPYNQIPMKWINFLGINALTEILQKEKPDIVINTFPMLAISEIRKRTGIQLPIFTVLTDFAAHGRWFHPETDKYFVATAELKTTMINKGIPAERIEVSGIPLRSAFDQQFNQKQITQFYGLDPTKKTVLVMAGAYGVLQNLRQLCQSLSRMKDIQVLLVCGKNQILKERLEANFSQLNNIHIFGFIEHIHEIMAISSCMVTKAGGITLSEALNMQLPVIIFRPIPGQEKENAVFLEQKGAALIANETKELVNKVKLILGEQNLQIKTAINLLRKKYALENIVESVLVATENMDKVNYNYLVVKEAKKYMFRGFLKTIASYSRL